jgi:hypothetical protein
MVASFVLALLATFLNINVISYEVNVTFPTGGAAFGLPGLMTLAVVPWAIFALMIVLSTLAVLYYCIEAVRVQHLGLLSNVKQILLLVVLGYGISVRNTSSLSTG